MIPDRARSTGREEQAAGAFRSQEGSRGRFRHYWTRGVKRFPRDSRLFEHDVGTLIREWIVPGFAPEAGMLSVRDSIVTIGSCFAGEVEALLGTLGCSSGSFQAPRQLANTHAILDFVSWCVVGDDIGRGYRYGRMADGEIREWTPKAERAEYSQRMHEAGAFLLGFGVTEVWEDRETGAVFWRGVPKQVYSPSRYQIRQTTVEENEANLVRIIELIRSVNGAAPIVLMLSPIPVPATFREIECIPADCVSKSVLRVAFDQVVSRELEGVYYWPTFEVVRWVGGHLPWRAYGNDDGKPHRITRYLLTQSLEAFVEAFYTPEALAEMRSH